MAVDRTTFRKCQSGGLTLIMIIMKYIKLLYSSYVIFQYTITTTAHKNYNQRNQKELKSSILIIIVLTYMFYGREWTLQ